MASAKGHREKAASNEAFYEELKAGSPARSDWALTALFYAAVHEVIAFLIDNEATVEQYGSLPARHSERIRILNEHTPWQPLAALYKTFQIWSNRGRYTLWDPVENDLKFAELQLKMIRDFIAAA